jgi:hypothetical protein
MFCVTDYLVTPHDFRTQSTAVLWFLDRNQRAEPTDPGELAEPDPQETAPQSHHARRSRARFGAGRAGSE